MNMSVLQRWVLGALACAAISPPATAAWHEAKSRHFLIYGDMRPQELEEYANKLEKFDQAVRIARSMGDPPLGDGGRLTIYRKIMDLIAAAKPIKALALMASPPPVAPAAKTKAK